MRDLKKDGHIRTDDDKQKSRLLPCSLCGTMLPHRRAFPLSKAKLAFRATVDAGEAWLPVRHSRVFCPDPPADTAAFWDDDASRELWKSAERLGMRSFADAIRFDERYRGKQ